MTSHRADAQRMLDDRGYSGHLIRGQAPHLLLPEGLLNRIVNSYYWKEMAFGLNGATLCDRAVELRYVGGSYSDGLRATPFICLILKMLQLDLEREIIDAYLKEGGEDFKYLRALAAFYIRLTEDKSEDVYKRLEPLLEDKRKLRIRGNNGFRLGYMDEFVDDLLNKERVCATSFWKLEPRGRLEEEDKLEERISPCQHLLDEEEERGGNGSRSGSYSDGSESRSRSRSRRGSYSSRSRSRSPRRGYDSMSESRSRSRSRRRKSERDDRLPNGHAYSGSERS